jgi:site-specific DNA-methyltransferase (adenine-specific)
VIEYFNEDCMAGMARYSDKYFDLAIVDPPYGIGAPKANIGARRHKNASCDGKDWDSAIPTCEYFDELRRVSKEQIIWGSNYFNSFFGNRGAIVWDKVNPLPTSSRCEIASYSKHQRVAYYRQVWTNYVNEKETQHPTEKPIALYKWLLTNYAKPGDKILDTHVGSASSLIACYDLGFDAVGFELDEDYYRISRERLENHMKQLRFSDMWEDEKC